MKDDQGHPPLKLNKERRIRFGPYEADLHTQELWRDGVRIRLAGHPARVLAILLSRPGDLITREEIQKQLWSEDTFSDSNHGLNAAVNKLREALNDAANDPRYIETLPRRGYRFIGLMETANSEEAVAMGLREQKAIEIPPHRAEMQVPSPRKRRLTPILVTAVASVAVFLGGFVVLSVLNGKRGHQPRPSLLVEYEHRTPESAAMSDTPAKGGHAGAREHSFETVPAIYRQASAVAPVPTVKTIITGPGGNAAPQISPDGRRIAFMSNRSGPWQIWVSDVDGSRPAQLSFTESAGTPRWSPDGQNIAFDAPSDDGTSIYVVRSDGNQSARALIEGCVPSFSRDGKWIYFASHRTGNWEVWKLPAGGGEPMQVTTHGGFAALESGDGYLYYSNSPQRNPSVCRVPVAGGEESCTLAHLRPRTWSSWAVTRDGILFVEDLPNGRSTLSLYGPETRELRDLISLQTAPVWVGASADGKTAIVNDTAEQQISLLNNLR